MMNFTCNECNDTGSRDKSGDYLDCGHCDAAMQRKALNDWFSGLRSKSPEDMAWAIHQRALAMAPKHEPRLVAQIVNNERDNEGNYINCHIISTGDHDIEHLAHGMKLYDAAPAAANGALTDEQIMRISCDMKQRNADVWPGDVAYARAILAAAGPDAALVEALEVALSVIDDYLAYTHDGDPWKEDARSMGEMDINDADNDGRIESWRAALSGAKGN